MSGLFVETASLGTAFCAGGFAAFINTVGESQTVTTVTATSRLDDHFMFLNFLLAEGVRGGGGDGRSIALEFDDNATNQ